MKIQRAKPKDATTERHILIGMIVSDDVCRLCRDIYNADFFQTKVTKEVSKWCMEFFDNYNTAPKQDIQSLFETKTKAGKVNPELEDEVEHFLSDISDEYQRKETDFNVSYYENLTRQYFKKRSYIILSEKIKEAAENDDVDEAEKTYASYTQVQEKQDTSRRLLTEEALEQVQLSLEARPPTLFYLPGPLGQMVGPVERGSLIGLLGREKAGKSYYLQLFAEAALKQGKSVVMFETGDLTHDQLDLRFYSSMLQRPVKEPVDDFVPVLDCLHNQTGKCEAVDSEPIVVFDMHTKQYKFTVDTSDKNEIKKHIPCNECYKDRMKRKRFKGSIWWKKQHFEPWHWGDTRRAIRRATRWGRGELITEAYDMETVKMSDIRDWIIIKQKQNGFLPHLVIIDYPDIMLPENSHEEYRHRENTKWKIARQISQEFSCCVLLVTQADAKSYGRDTLKLDNYSEDKRKYGHVTHFFAINKTEQEEEMGCSRLSTLLLRENSVKISQQTTVLHNLEVHRPYLASFHGRAPLLS